MGMHHAEVFDLDNGGFFTTIRFDTIPEVINRALYLAERNCYGRIEILVFDDTDTVVMSCETTRPAREIG